MRIEIKGSNLIPEESFEVQLLVMWHKGTGLSDGWKSTHRRPRRCMARPEKGQSRVVDRETPLRRSSKYSVQVDRSKGRM